MPCRPAGPAFGGESLGETFAAAILVIFSINGFLACYLVTRIYLGRAFAHADRAQVETFVKKTVALSQQTSQAQVMTVVKKEIEQVQETQREQQKADVDCLTLVVRRLEPEPGAPDISQAELDTAVAGASPFAKTQIFNRARDQRRQTWKTDKRAMERTIPVFRALISAETDRMFHRNRGQLGNALKDKEQPDLLAAQAALSEAIEIRDDVGDRGFLLYEFNRALARILQHGDNAPPEVREEIETDLKAAEASRYLRNVIAGDPVIKAFRAATPPTS